VIKIRNIFISGIHIYRQLSWPVKILLFVVCISVLTAGAIVVTGQPGFCDSCHIMNSFYDSWLSSAHSNVNCLDCHLQPGFTGYVKGKINGLAQVVDCVVGRVGTKPNAFVEDKSCLRSECHNTQELLSNEISFLDVKFTHDKHINTKVDGITISCGTCHSHFEGDEHFNVNAVVCYTCHFLKNNECEPKVVETSCQDCHKVPDKVIQRGLVKVNHAEFVSYNASCEDSCHKKEVEIESNVSENVCLNCHPFSMDRQANSSELHEIHSQGEKVECFACHGKVLHGRTEVASLSSMMDCRNCHSNTHQVQQVVYSAEFDMHNKDSDRILSPMFLTHVECTGCHIEPTQKETGILDSLGTVAKAIPGACDTCHEQGTGEKYIPFWQKQIKKLHESVSQKLDKFAEQVKLEPDKQLAQELNEKVKQAREILDSVELDGSWGVHNFKYTEAMLLRANEMIENSRVK
jgi:hypothetical protein